MAARGHAFWDSAARCSMRRVPESGGSARNPAEDKQATAHRRSAVAYASGAKTCIPMKKQNTARTGAVKAAKRPLVFHPSWIRLSGAPIAQQGFFKQSVPALNVVPV